MTTKTEKPRFDPMAYAKKMKVRGGAQVDYLPAGQKVRFLNHQFPGAQISVEPVHITDEMAIVKAIVILPNGARAESFGGVTKTDFKDYVEKADTRALARCCTRLGLDINGIYDSFAEGYVPVGDEEDFIPSDAEIVDEPGETPAPSLPIKKGVTDLPASEEDDTETYTNSWTNFSISDFSYLKDKTFPESEDVHLLRDTMRDAGYSPQGFLRHLYFTEEEAYAKKKIKVKPKAHALLSEIPSSLLDMVMDFFVNDENLPTK